MACETAELEEVSSKIATVYDYHQIPHYVRNDNVWFGQPDCDLYDFDKALPKGDSVLVTSQWLPLFLLPESLRLPAQHCPMSVGSSDVRDKALNPLPPLYLLVATTGCRGIHFASMRDNTPAYEGTRSQPVARNLRRGFATFVVGFAFFGPSAFCNIPSDLNPKVIGERKLVSNFKRDGL